MVNLTTPGQRLRYFINLYGEFIGIENLYEKYKEKVLKVKNSKEVPEEKLNKLTDTFRYWLQGLENGNINKNEALEDMKKKLGDNS